MADYWKSQPRKFCQYCKCWIADNKPSIEFHERGKNHKENVAAKISEIKKKSVDKAKKEAKASKEFAAMEEAALIAYEEDLKRMEREAAGLDSPPQETTPAKPQRKVVVINQVKNPPKKQKKHNKANGTPRDQVQTQVWVEGYTDDGSKYYYNTITGESQWQTPSGFQGQSSTSYQPGQTETSSGGLWLEAVSPEGHTYYYNSDTGESSWEKPANLLSIKPSEPSAEGTSQEASTTGEEKTSNGASASEKAEVPAEASQQCSVPKINFRKRKDGDEPTDEDSKEAISKVADKAKKEEVQSKSAESEKKEEEVAKKAPQVKRRRTANPYGAWERIKEEVDPYAKVDLQLPQLEGSSASAPAELPPEPKPKFMERIITSLGEEGGPTTFRKSKTQNGKVRSLRQRDDDD